MSEYIERAAAIKCAEESYKMWNLAMAAAEGAREINKCYKWQDICEAIGETFKIVPAADVAPVVHAYWKRVDKDDGWHDTVCSHCSTPIVTYLETPYCHNCGAKMDGGENNG